MPPSNRKYAKQNLARCDNLLDNVAGYVIAVGTAFIDAGKQINEAGENWPQQYLDIIETVDMLVDAIKVMKEAIATLEKSF